MIKINKKHQSLYEILLFFHYVTNKRYFKKEKRQNYIDACICSKVMIINKPVEVDSQWDIQR
jgi:hypothetical protein